MMKRNFRNTGLTLMELMVTMLISSILLVAVGIIMLDTQRGWQYTYTKVHGGAVVDAATAKTAFEKMFRKASRKKYIRTAADDITVFYYSNWLKEGDPDKYARFYRQNGTLFLKEGNIANADSDQTFILANRVTNAIFRPWPGAIQMLLTVQYPTESITATSTAELHNE